MTIGFEVSGYELQQVLISHWITGDGEWSDHFERRS
jgi:hypothetical protein